MRLLHVNAPNWRSSQPLITSAAAIVLALFVALLYYPLLFTNRVLASGDILLYFYPYRDFAAEALRNGHIPLWNPYIFLGVPFLANPQAAVLYPLHWPLIWLPVTKQIYWSAAIHTWLLGFGGYLLLRRWRVPPWAALVSALVLAGSGFYGGLIGHLNQMNGAAWLPWGIWILDFGAQGAPRIWGPRGGNPVGTGFGGSEARTLWEPDFGLWCVVPKARSAAVRSILFCIVGFAVVVMLMLLAGHTQTAYINLFALGVWTVSGTVAAWRRERFEQAARKPLLAYSQPLLIFVTGVLLGGLMSGAQLLPTLELSGLGLRSGGLSYGEATSLSLQPLDLLWTLLPTYGLVSLESRFGTPAYSELIAYVGLIGLLLAGVGAWKGRGTARTFGLLFATLGLFLALGRWNPFYYMLYLAVPGFDLFRTPARWMMLYTLGMAVLAGAGATWVGSQIERLGRSEIRDQRLTQHQRDRLPDLRSPISDPRSPFSGLWSLISNLRSLISNLQSPFSDLRSLISNLFPPLLLLLLALDLLLAAQALPHRHPTAPQAVDEVRTAPAHLLTDPARSSVGPAAMGRFLGMSTITYDPGDLADWHRILREEPPPQLDEESFNQFIIALKVQELLVPNLSLFRRLPAVDGFDGGVLPLQRYNEFLTLFVPRAELVPDGRLREQLRSVPSTALLNLVHGQYLITDKVRDLWFEDIFYDRQIGARLRPEFPQVVIEASQPFATTHLDLIAYVDGPPAELEDLAGQKSDVATVTVSSEAGQAAFTLTAGGQPGADLADGTLDSPVARSSGATVAYRDVQGGRQEYRVRLTLPALLTPRQVTIQRLPTPFDVVVQAVTLVDERTGMFTPLLPSDRGRFRLVHSGDVKIYENLDLLPRAYLVHEVIGVESAAAALDALRSGQVRPGNSAVVEGLSSFTSTRDDSDSASIAHYEAERVEVHTRTAKSALLVLSDTAFPGWTATVDGIAAPVYTTNYLFRGVAIPPGQHTVTFTYQPESWQLGLWLSGSGLVLCLLLLVAGWWRRPGTVRPPGEH